MELESCSRLASSSGGEGQPGQKQRQEQPQRSEEIVREIIESCLPGAAVKCVSREQQKATTKQERLTQYLDFVKLYSEVHKKSTAKREANLLWKQKIQPENTETLSMCDFLEQLSLLRGEKIRQKAKETPEEDPGVEFTCSGADRSVKIAGTFNSWQPAALRYQNDSDSWQGSFHLPVGKHRYKFVVDGEWLADPARPTETDEDGNTNNVIVVDDEVTKKLKQMKEELQQLHERSAEPWRVESRDYNFCPR